MDYFEAVGALGLGSRLKRLSDAFMLGSKRVYELTGHDFEPRWFPLFSLLYADGTTTVSAAADKLKITHPHVSLLAKELNSRKLITWKSNPKDKRSRTITLSAKGLELAKQIQPLWDDIRTAADKVVQDVDLRFMERLESLEKALFEIPFEQRVHGAKKARLAKQVEVIAYSPRLKSHFERLNREWIEKYFEIESHDTKLFKNPEKEVIQKGGAIIFAKIGADIVGTCSLLYSDEENGGYGYELAKLSVAEAYKGLGLGELLCQEIIRLAKEKGAKTLSLTTNSRLGPAIHLYEKLGFRETFRGHHDKYQRVDLVMALKLL